MGLRDSGGVQAGGLRYVSEIAAIPDSAIHQWTLEEDTDPFVDSIGSADGTNNGTTQVSGDYVGGAARAGDGTSQWIRLTPLSTWGSEMANDFAIAFTIETTTTGFGSIFTGRNSAGNTLGWVRFGDSANSAAGELYILLRDEDSNDLQVVSDNAYNDGSKYRVVLNKTSGSNIDIYVNGSQEPATTITDQGFSNPADFDIDAALFARHSGGGSTSQHLDGTLDNVILANDSWTATEISDDYQNQPWATQTDGGSFSGGTIEDWEDNDFNADATDWGSWTGEWNNNIGSGTIVGGALTVESTDPISGTYYGELTTQGDDPRVILSTVSGTYSPSTVSVRYRIDNDTGNSNDGTKFELRANGSLLIQGGFESGNGGTIEAENTDTGSDWTAGTEYLVEWTNIDWTNNQADFAIDGTVVASNVDMRQSVSGLDAIGVRTHTGSGGGGSSGQLVNLAFDDLAMTL